MRRSRRHSRPPPSPAPSPPLASSYVSVRVMDFVTIPYSRLSDPPAALGPLDTAFRPPSYDLSTRPKVKHACATQTDQVEWQWDGHSVDRVLDEESQLDDTNVSTVSTEEQVFFMGDGGHVDRLLDIVTRGIEKEDIGAGDTGESSSEQEEEEEEEEEGCHGNKDLFLGMSSSTSTLTSSAPDASACSGVSTWGRSISAEEEGNGGNRKCEEVPSPGSSQGHGGANSSGEAFRKGLMLRSLPSPVKYTFLPPMAYGADRGEEALGSSKVVQVDRGEEVVGVATVVGGEVRRRSEGSMSSVSGEGGVVNGGSGGLGIVLRRRRRRSDESGAGSSGAASSETEYYEDEYTRFIERRGVRLGLSGFEGLRTRLECRSNSTVSVATSDDEYRGEGSLGGRGKE